MDYCVWNGCLVVLLIRHCTSEGLSSSNLPLSGVGLQDGQALPRAPDVAPADVVPVVAPASLKEAQQVKQEASAKTEGHAAEEVLKELLEKVVEAAMGQGERGGEAKGDEAAVQEAVVEDALGADTEEVLEQVMAEKEVEGKAMGPEGGDAAVGKEQVVPEVGTSKDGAKEGERVVKEKGATAAGSVEETAAGVAPGGRGGADVVNESLDTEVGQEERGAASEETGGDVKAQGAEVEDVSVQGGFTKAKGAAEAETHGAEETLDVVKVVLSEERENEGVEQLGDVQGVQEEETHADGIKDDVVKVLSEGYDTETTNAVVGEEEEEEVVDHAEDPQAERTPGHVEVRGGVDGGEKPDGTNVSVATGGESEAREKLVNAGVDQRAGEEAHAAVEPPRGSETEDGEAPSLSDPVPEYGAEASVEQNQGPTASPSLGGDKSDHGNEIITPTDDLLGNGPVAVAQPTLDNLVTDVLAQHPRSGENETVWAVELVEHTAGTTEASEPGLEAWKIGAVSAAVFLIVEIIVIGFYVVKRRNRSSASAVQRACEEGCVELEEATGGDCSDDTLPADSEQIATLDPRRAASTPTRSEEQQEVERATAMSDFPSSTTEGVANAGPEPDSSQDLRTSML